MIQRIAEVFPLAIPPRHPKRTALEIALRAIDGVHHLPLMQSIGVRCEPLDFEGLFDPALPYYGVRLSDMVEHPAMTLVHEIGHALDYFAFGSPNGWMSESANLPSMWRDWLQLTLASRAARMLERLTQSDAPPSVREVCLYHLQPKELFARCYAQYIAHYCGHSTMRSELEVLQRQTPASQWSDDEFKNIVEAFEAVLELHGIKRLSGIKK
jgi:hypothetical protein